MSLWRTLSAGLRSLLRPEDADRSIEDEVRHYLDEEVAARVAAGATPEEARREVRLRWGDTATVCEEVHSHGWENAIEATLIDLRYAARRLRRSPGFTAVAVLTLGLGIGATTAIFSAVRSVLLEPLAYPEADRLVAITDRSGFDGSAVPVAFGTYREIAARSRTLEALAVTRTWQPTVTGEGEPERLEGQRVSADYHRLLGVRPVLGPGFDPADDLPGGPDVVILSDRLWRRRFAGDSAIVGATVRLDDRPFTVVGVMPSGFENVPGRPAEAWALLQYDLSLPSFDGREWGHHLEMVGRLRASVAPEAMKQELDRIAASPLPDLARPTWASMGQGLDVRPLKEAATAGARPALVPLLGAVVLLLVIACVNVASLLLARGVRRRGELAVRAALGAGRGRLVRQLLVESLLLAGLGGALGVAIAALGIDALVALVPPGLPRAEAIGMDGKTLAVVLAITTVVGVALGLAPALAVSRGDLHGAVRVASQRSGRRQLAVRRALVVAEVALALVLLVGAGLLLRSVGRLFSVPPGFDAQGVLAMQVQTVGRRFQDDEATWRFFASVLEAVREVPGVESAGLTSQLPLSGDLDVFGVRLLDTDQPEGEDGAAYRYVVSPGYFEAMGIPPIRGRLLGEQDDARAPKAVVISASLAEGAFGGRDPIGRRLHIGRTDLPPYTVVGVVGDLKQESLEVARGNAVYVTPSQWYFADRALWIVARREGDPEALAPALRRAIWSVDPRQPIVHAYTLETLVARSEARRRFALTVLETFALLALLLAGIGLYGVLAGSVAEQTREIGVRSALGASRGGIVFLVVRQALGLAGLGVVIGLGVATAASSLLASLLFDVSRLDPATYLAVVAVVAAVAALAASLPATRAARVDPANALRAE